MFYPKLEGPALEAYRMTREKVKSTCMKQLGLSEDEVVIRPLRPEDYGASSIDAYMGITAAGWESVISAQTIDDNRFIGICGFYSGSTSGSSEGDVPISQIRITRKGSVTRYWPVKEIQGWEEKIGYADDPITVDQNTTITLDVWGRTASSISNIGLVGVVAESRGLLVNP